MNVSREFAIQELESVRKHLGLWIRELKDPETEAYGKDENGKPQIPVGLSVNQVDGIPTNQFRAELTACAAKLEALAAT